MKLWYIRSSKGSYIRLLRKPAWLAVMASLFVAGLMAMVSRSATGVQVSGVPTSAADATLNVSWTLSAGEYACVIAWSGGSYPSSAPNNVTGLTRDQTSASVGATPGQRWGVQVGTSNTSNCSSIAWSDPAFTDVSAYIAPPPPPPTTTTLTITGPTQTTTTTQTLPSVPSGPTTDTTPAVTNPVVTTTKITTTVSVTVTTSVDLAAALSLIQQRIDVLEARVQALEEAVGQIIGEPKNELPFTRTV